MPGADRVQLVEGARRTARPTRGRRVGQPAFLTTQTAWGPFAFIDRCEEVRNGRQCMDMLCRKIRLLEYGLLLRYCAEQAVV